MSFKVVIVLLIFSVLSTAHNDTMSNSNIEKLSLDSAVNHSTVIRLSEYNVTYTGEMTSLAKVTMTATLSVSTLSILYIVARILDKLREYRLKYSQCEIA